MLIKIIAYAGTGPFLLLLENSEIILQNQVRRMTMRYVFFTMSLKTAPTELKSGLMRGLTFVTITKLQV